MYFQTMQTQPSPQSYISNVLRLQPCLGSRMANKPRGKMHHHGFVSKWMPRNPCLMHIMSAETEVLPECVSVCLCVRVCVCVLFGLAEGLRF